MGQSTWDQDMAKMPAKVTQRGYGEDVGAI